MEPVTSKTVTVTVNGASYERDVDARRLLVHFIRDALDLTRHPHRLRHRQLRGLHRDRGRPAVKSCMMLAVQADGASIETVEALASGDGHRSSAPSPRTTPCSAATAPRGC